MKRPRGLALVSPRRRKEIAARGMARLKREGKQNKFTTGTARAALRQRADRQDNTDE